jgi:signal transduction histidine kinase
VSDPRRFTPARARAAAIVLLAAGILASAYQDRVFRAQRIRELKVQGEILAASITAALVFGDPKTVQEHVSALVINPEIEAAGVYDDTGALVASFARSGKNTLPRTASGGTRGDATVLVEVRHDDDSLGTVHIRASEEPMGRRLARHAAIMLLAVMAALLLAFMGSAQRTLQNEMEERGKAQDALRQSQKMEAVGQLSGGVAHDFNNLLTIISGNLHLLREGFENNQPGLEVRFDAAEQAIERAGQLVRRLLAFSRRQPLSPRSVELSELAEGMKPLIVHSVGDRVRVEWQLKAKWKAFCDVNQMENVILNLAINARDAMPEGGTLTIETNDVSRGDEVHVELRVTDTGTGMTNEVRERAVEPFFTTKPHGQGTGLGLSMAYAFTRESNGHLNIETLLGSGTAISILLPRHRT